MFICVYMLNTINFDYIIIFCGFFIYIQQVYRTFSKLCIYTYLSHGPASGLLSRFFLFFFFHSLKMQIGLVDSPARCGSRLENLRRKQDVNNFQTPTTHGTPDLNAWVQGLWWHGRKNSERKAGRPAKAKLPAGCVLNAPCDRFDLYNLAVPLHTL